MATSFLTRLGFAPEEGIKAPCVASSAVNISLTGEQTISGVPVVANDRVLVRSQSDPAENGIYVVQSGAWVLASDFNKADDVIDGMIVIDANEDVMYRMVFTGDYDPGVTEVTFNALIDTTTLALLASILTGEGASLVGVEDAAGYFIGTNVEAVLAEIRANYASTANGLGASLIGVRDATNKFSSTTVEGVLAEIINTYAGTSVNQGASKIGVQDSGGYYSGTNVEAVLQDIGANYMKKQPGSPTNTVLVFNAQGQAINSGRIIGATASGSIVTVDAVQTLLGKSIDANYLLLPESAAPAPTINGEIWWDNVAKLLKVGNGATTESFYPGSQFTVGGNMVVCTTTQAVVVPSGVTKMFAILQAGGGGGAGGGRGPIIFGLGGAWGNSGFDGNNTTVSKVNYSVVAEGGKGGIRGSALTGADGAGGGKPNEENPRQFSAVTYSTRNSNGQLYSTGENGGPYAGTVNPTPGGDGGTGMFGGGGIGSQSFGVAGTTAVYGGGGGGGPGERGAAGGGGGAGEACFAFMPVTPGENISVFIGAGGGAGLGYTSGRSGGGGGPGLAILFWGT